MKKLWIILLLLFPLQWVMAQNLQPYVLGFETTENLSVIAQKIQSNLEQNDISVLGQYQPANDKNRWIIIFGSPELEAAVKKVGGLSGFAAALRIAITQEGGKTLVSYTNPAYWGNAYFRNDYDKVSAYYNTLTDHLENALKASGTYIGRPFGSKKGLEVKELRKYHYMFGMPYFDDNIELGEFSSYASTLAKIESNIAKGVSSVKMVYKVSIPGKELTLYGFGLSGEKGESKFMPIIDINNPKHTAFLPYEILVMGNKAYMLHGRFRIALSFPDLTMGTFSKIMSTPGDIEDLLEQVVK
ncbi:MAG: hypothetical protein Q7J34_05910 [Bacteroidales bacterium]|nr:hypothetical protein [Bacteroidales bacterium]